MATGRLPAYLDRGADPQILSRGAARRLGAATPWNRGAGPQVPTAAVLPAGSQPWHHLEWPGSATMRGCGHPQEHKRSKLFLARAPRRGCVQPPISHFTRQVHEGQEYALHPDIYIYLFIYIYLYLSLNLHEIHENTT